MPKTQQVLNLDDVKEQARIVKEHLRIIDEVVDNGIDAEIDNEVEIALGVVAESRTIIDEVMDGDDEVAKALAEAQLDPKLQLDDSAEAVLESLRALPSDLEEESYLRFSIEHEKVLAKSEVTEAEVRAAIEELDSPPTLEDLKKIGSTIAMLTQAYGEVDNTRKNLQTFYVAMAALLLQQLKSISNDIESEHKRLARSSTKFRDKKREVLNRLWVNIEGVIGTLESHEFSNNNLLKVEEELKKILLQAKEEMAGNDKNFSSPFKRIIAALGRFFFGKELFPNKAAELVKGLGEKCSSFFSQPDAEHSVLITQSNTATHPPAAGAA